MTEPRFVKQVIIMRKFPGMPRGKEIAQGSHASMSFLVRRMVDKFDNSTEHFIRDIDEQDFSNAEIEWLTGKFTKVTLQVSTDEELVKVYEDAKAAGLEAHIVKDLGATVFHGVPTNTAVAIGPDYADRIDPVTKHLKLY